MFSPYYARARRRGGARPQNHVALNVALYGAAGPGWSMTERGTHALSCTHDTLAIGPSRLHWQDGALHIDIDEWTVPLPRRLRGRIVLRPAARHAEAIALDAAGHHLWTPMAPVASVELAFDQPGWRWSGHGYLDSNHGDRPLEADFTQWHWSRATMPDGGTAVLYDAARRDGSRFALGRQFHADGASHPITVPPQRPLGRFLWGMRPAVHSQQDAQLLRRLEDSPFYTRALARTVLQGQPVTAIQETLSLDRFRSPLVRAMLPFRMPRRP